MYSEKLRQHVQRLDTSVPDWALRLKVLGISLSQKLSAIENQLQVIN